MISPAYDDMTVCTESGIGNGAARVELIPCEQGFHVDVEFTCEPLTKLMLRWRCPSPIGARILGDHWERGYGDLEWRGLVPERLLPWYVLLHDPARGITHGLGVATGTPSFAAWQVDAQGICLILDLRNGSRGVRLGDRRLRAATVHALTSEREDSVFDFAGRFCRRLCPAPRLPTFPVYGGNDWYYAYGKNSDASIRRDAALIRELSPSSSNPPFMVIDAGWFPSWGCNGGPYHIGNADFPDMPRLAEDMVSMAVRPGIWIRPLLATEAPNSWQLPARHPVWRRESQVALDPSVPDVLEHVRQDITRLREWGYQLIKHDFTTFDMIGRWGFEMGDGPVDGASDWHFADRSRTTAEIMLELYRTIRAAADDVLLIGCNTVGHLAAGLFELQRTGDDTSGKEWERTRKMGINTLAFRMPQHDAFFAADADCVGVTSQVPWDMNRQWLELLAASGTPLFVSADPNAIGVDQRRALTDAFARAAVAQPPAEPLDWMHTTCPSHWRLGEEERVFNWGV